MRPGHCSGSYAEPPRARAIALRSSSCPREVDATTFSIRNFAMGTPPGRDRGSRRRWNQLHATGPLYTSVRPGTPPGRPNGPLPETAGPRNHEPCRPLTPQCARRGRLPPPTAAGAGRPGSPPVEGDHVPAMVRRPGLPVLDHAQDAVPGLLPHRHELRHLRRGPRVLERPLEHGEASVRDDGDLVRHLVQEAAVVAHDEHHTRIRPQGRGHDLLALDVEVVRRLVEDEEVVVLGDELRERETCAFSAAELADAAVDRVPPEPEAAEEASRPSLRWG